MIVTLLNVEVLKQFSKMTSFEDLDKIKFSSEISDQMSWQRGGLLDCTTIKSITDIFSVIFYNTLTIVNKNQVKLNTNKTKTRQKSRQYKD